MKGDVTKPVTRHVVTVPDRPVTWEGLQDRVLKATDYLMTRLESDLTTVNAPEVLAKLSTIIKQHLVEQRRPNNNGPDPSHMTPEEIEAELATKTRDR